MHSHFYVLATHEHFERSNSSYNMQLFGIIYTAVGTLPYITVPYSLYMHMLTVLHMHITLISFT